MHVEKSTFHLLQFDQTLLILLLLPMNIPLFPTCIHILHSIHFYINNPASSLKSFITRKTLHYYMEKHVVRSKNNTIMNILAKYTSFSLPHSPIHGRRSGSKAKFKKLHNEKPANEAVVVHKKNIGNISEAQEPTSPKISCMGQIKHKKAAVSLSRRSASFSTVKKRFSQNERIEKESMEVAGSLMSRAPTLSEMRRFSSGYEALKDFDWKDHRRLAASHGGRLGYNSEESDEKVALKSRKEINIWKRRTVSPLTPLQLN